MLIPLTGRLPPVSVRVESRLLILRLLCVRRTNHLRSPNAIPSSYCLISPYCFTLEETLYFRRNEQRILQRSYPLEPKVVFLCAKGCTFAWVHPCMPDHAESQNLLYATLDLRPREGEVIYAGKEL